MKTNDVVILSAIIWLSSLRLTFASPDEKSPKIPDFTKGDVVPSEAKHHWNQAPTDLRGWMFCDRLVTADAREIAITAVEHRTPEILEVLDAYGAEAKVIIPHLEETAALFDKGAVNFPKNLSKQKAKAVRDAIQKIKSAKDHPELRSLK